MSIHHYVLFARSNQNKTYPESLVFLHYGGDQEIKSIQDMFSEFFSEIQDRCSADTRFDDASTLAARFVAYLASRDACGLNFTGIRIDTFKSEFDPLKSFHEGLTEFLSRRASATSVSVVYCDTEVKAIPTVHLYYWEDRRHPIILFAAGEKVNLVEEAEKAATAELCKAIQSIPEMAKLSLRQLDKKTLQRLVNARVIHLLEE